MNTERPSTALSLKDISAGMAIVVYSPHGDYRQEIRIEGFDDIIDRGEVASLVRYHIIGDGTKKIYTNEPASLGLAQSQEGEWYRYAIPFDE